MLRGKGEKECVFKRLFGEASNSVHLARGSETSPASPGRLQPRSRNAHPKAWLGQQTSLAGQPAKMNSQLLKFTLKLATDDDLKRVIPPFTLTRKSRCIKYRWAL